LLDGQPSRLHDSKHLKGQGCLVGALAGVDERAEGIDVGLQPRAARHVGQQAHHVTKPPLAAVPVHQPVELAHIWEHALNRGWGGGAAGRKSWSTGYTLINVNAI
jgi:hypothetical protein